MAVESGITFPSMSTNGSWVRGALRTSPVTVSYFWSVMRRYVSTFMTKGLASGRPKAGPNL